MIDFNYYEWFRQETSTVKTLTWCSATDIDDVLAAYGIAPERTQPTYINRRDDISMLIGRLGNGAMILDYRIYPAPSGALPALAQFGPCLSAAWCDDVPAIVSCRDEGGLVVSFDAMAWDWEPFPDLASVERWISVSPAGRKAWDTSWGFATLICAEALLQAVVDDEWIRSTHVGVTN